MSAPDWPTLYADTIERFGGNVPHHDLAAQLLETFESHPQAIARLFDRIAASYEAGTVRSPWGVIRNELAKLKAHPPGKPNPALERSKRIERAEQWIRNAGLHIPTEPELLDELFGDRGMLRQWAQYDPDARLTDGDQALIERMTGLWHEHRPAGERIDAEAEARGLAYQAQRRPAPRLEDAA